MEVGEEEVTDERHLQVGVMLALVAALFVTHESIHSEINAKYGFRSEFGFTTPFDPVPENKSASYSFGVFTRRVDPSSLNLTAEDFRTLYALQAATDALQYQVITVFLAVACIGLMVFGEVRALREAVVEGLDEARAGN